MHWCNWPSKATTMERERETGREGRVFWMNIDFVVFLTRSIVTARTSEAQLSCQRHIYPLGPPYMPRLIPHIHPSIHSSRVHIYIQLNCTILRVCVVSCAQCSMPGRHPNIDCILNYLLYYRLRTCYSTAIWKSRLPILVFPTSTVQTKCWPLGVAHRRMRRQR